MKLKNREVLNLAKFFLFDETSQRIQYKFETHQRMARNLTVFRDTYSKLASMERSILELKGSEIYQKFFEDLKKESLQYLQTDDEGNLVERAPGEARIIPGKEEAVFRIQENLSGSEEYSVLFEDLKKRETDLRELLEEECGEELLEIYSSGLNLEELTLNSEQWDLISVLFVKE